MAAPKAMDLDGIVLSQKDQVQSQFVQVLQIDEHESHMTLTFHTSPMCVSAHTEDTYINWNGHAMWDLHGPTHPLDFVCLFHVNYLPFLILSFGTTKVKFNEYLIVGSFQHELHTIIVSRSVLNPHGMSMPLFTCWPPYKMILVTSFGIYILVPIVCWGFVIPLFARTWFVYC